MCIHLFIDVDDTNEIYSITITFLNRVNKSASDTITNDPKIMEFSLTCVCCHFVQRVRHNNPENSQTGLRKPPVALSHGSKESNTSSDAVTSHFPPPTDVTDMSTLRDKLVDKYLQWEAPVRSYANAHVQ